MLIPQQARCETPLPHGGRHVSLAELRGNLASPSLKDDGRRQRLFSLARRVARVRALGGEYRRVGLSEHAMSALEGSDLPTA